ncbi:hypothetical protein ACVOMV_32065 [Mesorhizobium atlanticum]
MDIAAAMKQSLLREHKRLEEGAYLRVRMNNRWTLYDPRLAWMLVAPVLLLLIFFLVLPIAVMAAYTFFTFVTAGVETSALTTANWQEFFTDSYYSGFLLKTLRVGCDHRAAVRGAGLFPGLFHMGDELQAQMAAAFAAHSCRSGSASPSAPFPG